MKITDSNTPLHLLKVKYPIQYRIPKKKQIIKKLSRVLKFLNEVTPADLVNEDGVKISSKNAIDEKTLIPESAFRLNSYEWGVTYAGLLKFGEVTELDSFSNYTIKRLGMISDLSHFYLENKKFKVDKNSPIYSVLFPDALDDCGAICSSMIMAQIKNSNLNLSPIIDNFIDYISQRQIRFEDGTLARNRPYPNSLWLDDLFMSVPALALMGKMTKNEKFFDDSVHQVNKFSERMFVEEKSLYFHGWVENMEPHPKFYWGRANGWAVMALVELLTYLPKNHIGFPSVLEQFIKHLNGLVACQSGSGFWHQLLDKNDSYLETSATAIITYSIAKAINEGIIDKFAFSPIAILGWNAISTKINVRGQINGTCVGTGMGFDQAFYYHRPVNKFAAHGYGPMFLAGAEIVRLVESNDFELVEGALHIKN